MLTKNEMIELIEQGENSFIEFKQEQEKNEDLLRTIVAFANGKGGYLFIGVDDHGQVRGVSEPKLLEERIMNSCTDSLKPVIIPEVYFTKIHQKDIVVFYTPMGINKPYAVVRHKKERFYLRRGTTVKEATREELLRLYQASGHINYELTPVMQADVSDIHLNHVRHFFLYNPRNPVDIHSFSEKERLNFLINKEILVEYDGQLKPTLAGMLLFGDAPERFLFFSGITLTRFKGDKRDYEYVDHKINGSIIPRLDSRSNVVDNGIVQQTIDFIEGLLIDQANAHLENSLRVLEFPYKIESIREAIVNAVAHRDYTITGADIGVEIYDNRIEIHSPGRIPNTLTIEKMKVGAKYYRNQILIQYMKDAGLVDMHSLGIPIKILKLSTEYSGQEPRLEESGYEFIVTIYAK